MKIACNYYQETEQLFDENRIDIDYFKYSGLGFQMGIMETNYELSSIKDQDLCS